MAKNLKLKRIFRITFLILLAGIFSCTTIKFKEPFVFSNFSEVQELERQDHKFCISLNLNSGNDNNFTTQTYWQCRLSLAKNRLNITNFSNSEKVNSFQINDLVSKISLHISEIGESNFTKENKKLDELQHNQCLRLGFNNDTLDKSKIDDYLLCRKRLLEEYRFNAPFGNLDYLEYPNNSYNIDFVIEQRQKKEEEKFNSAKEKYPTCIKYNLRKQNFKNCTLSQDKSRQCLSEISGKKFKKELAEKITCQKQSYVNFPESFLKKGENGKKLELEKVKALADDYNSNSFVAIGIDEMELSDFKAKTKEEKTEKDQKEIAEKFNKKTDLYSKYELITLRQEYIYKCQKNAEAKILEYEKSLKSECEDMAKFDIIDE
ncbi:MAG: hypothetical protein FJ368_04275 [Pelagibacterales bacterium]|nr:hypothetical protein [Pelagibacterales bacterium]